MKWLRYRLRGDKIDQPAGQMPHLHIMQNHRCGYGHLPQRIHKLTLRDWKLAGSRGSLQKSDDVTLVMGSISQQAKKPYLILHPPEKERGHSPQDQNIYDMWVLARQQSN